MLALSDLGPGMNAAASEAGSFAVPPCVLVGRVLEDNSLTMVFKIAPTKALKIAPAIILPRVPITVIITTGTTGMSILHLCFHKNLPTVLTTLQAVFLTALTPLHRLPRRSLSTSIACSWRSLSLLSDALLLASKCS